MKKIATQHRRRVARFRQAGGALTPSAVEIANDVQFMDEANNLAIDVAASCKKLDYALARVLKDPRATRIFIQNLRQVIGPMD